MWGPEGRRVQHLRDGRGTQGLWRRISYESRQYEGTGGASMRFRVQNLKVI